VALDTHGGGGREDGRSVLSHGCNIVPSSRCVKGPR
jgi:hypothetical protein